MAIASLSAVVMYPPSFLIPRALFRFDKMTSTTRLTSTRHHRAAQETRDLSPANNSLELTMGAGGSAQDVLDAES